MNAPLKILRSAASARWAGYGATCATCLLGAVAVDLALDLRLPVGDTLPPAIVRTLCAIAAIIIASEATSAFEDFVGALSGDIATDEPAALANYLHWPVATAVAAFAAGIALRGWSREVASWL